MEERFRNLDYQNWKPVRTLGSDSYGTVYEIARDDGFGMVDHAALKVLSIPAAPEDFDTLVAEGAHPRGSDCPVPPSGGDDRAAAHGGRRHQR